jgi:hypothetical protein
MFDACVPAGETKKWYFSCMFFALSFDTLVFGLALYQGIFLIRQRNSVQRHQGGVTAIGRIWKMRGELVGVIVRDSILFPLM